MLIIKSMEKKLLLILMSFFVIFLYGQDNVYYYFGNERIYLTTDYSRITVVSKDTFNLTEINNTLGRHKLVIKYQDINYSKQNVNYDSSDTSIVEISYLTVFEISGTPPAPVDYESIIEDLSKKKNSIKVNRSFIYQSQRLGLSNNFYVKLHDEKEKAKLLELSKVYSLKILGNNQFMPLWYTLTCDKECEFDVLSLANIFL